MLSPVSPSKWQVQDFSSTASLMYSESDQTEDESEIFSSEGEYTCSLPVTKKSRLGKRSKQTSKSPLESVDQGDVCVENGRLGGSSVSPAVQSSASTTKISTEGDLRFACKCSELHGYVRPLLELLNGLKTGRFEKGLSTFQQSMAVERLRKILGVLQKPDLGDKYMGTILQLEVLLKAWFPQVIPQHHDGTSSLHNPMARVQPRWNQDQLHIPVKKRRLSWSDSESQSSPSCKRFHEEERGQSLGDTSSWLSSSETTPSDLEDDNGICAIRKERASELELAENVSVHPLQQKTDSLNVAPATRTTGNPPPLVIPTSAKDGSNVGTQDCSVSSTTPTSDSPADSEVDERDQLLQHRAVVNR
ncbi:circadian associated repressor of transcription a [Triplophysa dalaica]|uniref:circadian associated repressor of transcription a n=1 Tax=Triplophysa dalaica TaxID=1582913 RepID=UPI0024DF4160|nr:circadian associated repressor of transcription a [Triplophysa dalaica]